MKKSFTTTIEENTQNDFRKACKKNSVTMSEVLEVFMTEYANDGFRLETKKVLKQAKQGE
ncbi:hypothetical protein KCL52_000068 [Clostridium perfringens]|nr:hypothetical protein [Clostridium perfringens]MDU7547744.1 hypothetical protein [Clostridium perfringens]